MIGYYCNPSLPQAEASHSTLLSHPALTRHFGHIQSLPQLSAALSHLFVPAHVQIDVDNVPLVEIKPDVKVKKPKPEAGAAAAAAETPVKQANVAKAVSDKKKGEQKGEAAAAAGGVEGAKPEGKKKEKGPKEKKPAAPAPVAEAPAPWMVDLRVGKIVDGELLSSLSPCWSSDRSRRIANSAASSGDLPTSQSRFTRTPTRSTSSRSTSERPSRGRSCPVSSSTRPSMRVRCAPFFAALFAWNVLTMTCSHCSAECYSHCGLQLEAGEQ